MRRCFERTVTTTRKHSIVTKTAALHQNEIRDYLARVALGGHAVPAEKIRSRYRKVMNESLPRILPLIDTCDLFDNSDALLVPCGQ
jgi:predicted ABC-type ATPase